MNDLDALLAEAATAIHSADALLICAGAGIGVDSGLPDFRGNDGFWRAYPPLAKARIRFEQIANPRTFHVKPRLAWGFYGHRFNTYRDTVPHDGFAILKAWADAKPFGAFVFTSNVDAQFEKAGFAPERIAECHGSLFHLQCLAGCSRDIWSAPDEPIPVDETTCTATGDLPTCPRCGGIARPNVLMFGDSAWEDERANAQTTRLEAWLGTVLTAGATLAIVELGAGKAIPTVRRLSEQVAQAADAPLVRINPRDAFVPRNVRGVPIALGAREALRRIVSIPP